MLRLAGRVLGLINAQPKPMAATHSKGTTMLHARATPERLSAFSEIATLCLFGVAAVVALKYPLVGLGICCCCLIVYLKPDAPGAGKQISRSASR